MEFKEWKDEADMPHQLEDGTWVDLETGLPYQDKKLVKKSTKICDQAILKIIKEIKEMGGKALSGSLKQKMWAEKIRYEHIKGWQADKVSELLIGGGILNTSKFWIENKGVDFCYSDVQEAVLKLEELQQQYFETLARTGLSSEKSIAREAIIKAIRDSKVRVHISFPNFDPYKEIENADKKEMRDKKLKGLIQRKG